MDGSLTKYWYRTLVIGTTTWQRPRVHGKPPHPLLGAMTVIYMNRSRQSKKDPNRHAASAAPGFCYGTEALKCLEGHEVEGMAACESDTRTQPYRLSLTSAGYLWFQENSFQSNIFFFHINVLLESACKLLRRSININWPKSFLQKKKKKKSSNCLTK